MVWWHRQETGVLLTWKHSSLLQQICERTSSWMKQLWGCSVHLAVGTINMLSVCKHRPLQHCLLLMKCLSNFCPQCTVMHRLYSFLSLVSCVSLLWGKIRKISCIRHAFHGRVGLILSTWCGTQDLWFVANNFPVFWLWFLIDSRTGCLIVVKFDSGYSANKIACLTFCVVVQGMWDFLCHSHAIVCVNSETDVSKCHLDSGVMYCLDLLAEFSSLPLILWVSCQWFYTWLMWYWWDGFLSVPAP